MMPTSEEEIYQDHILDHYEAPYHRGRCPHCTHRHQEDNPLCGDVVRMELSIDHAGTPGEAAARISIDSADKAVNTLAKLGLLKVAERYRSERRPDDAKAAPPSAGGKHYASSYLA